MLIKKTNNKWSNKSKTLKEESESSDIVDDDESKSAIKNHCASQIISFALNFSGILCVGF